MKEIRKSVIARLTPFEFTRLEEGIVQTGMSKSEIIRYALNEFYEKHIMTALVAEQMYLCKCECGNMIEVSRADLESGKVTSCGCGDE